MRDDVLAKFFFLFLVFILCIKRVIVLHCTPSDACKCRPPWHCIWLFGH